MKGNQFDKAFLWAVFINLIMLPLIVFRKPPIKDWLLVYLYNAVTNGIADKILSYYKIVKYPVRLLPKLFKAHILFD